MSFFTGKLEEKSNLLEFYDQTIPEEVKRLPSYQSHIESYGELIEKVIFDHSQAEYAP